MARPVGLLQEAEFKASGAGLSSIRRIGSRHGAGIRAQGTNAAPPAFSAASNSSRMRANA
jgi:hypothetical protein